MKHLIKHKVGTVAIMTILSDDINPSDEINKWQDHQKEKVESHRPLNEDELPDRYFRDAWRHKDDKICLDLDHCKRIHQKNILDAQKEAVKPMDSGIANATTPEEIKAFMPDSLK